MYARHRLDVTARDLSFALGACLWARRADARAVALAARWAARQGLVCLSVRSAFDLLLESLDLPAGSEILFTAVTHPDMLRIAERHGLRPVPVDVEIATLGPPPDLVEAAVTPTSRAIVVAHLFGARARLDEVAAVARRHGLLLVEDCAQTFRGPDDIGDEQADVSMFSFGVIKATTAAGGALVRVGDERLLETMRCVQATWPRQTRRDYAKRVLTCLCLLALSPPWSFGLFVSYCRRRGRDFDAVLGDFVKARRSATELERFARRRPSPPLLALLERRLRRFDPERLACRARRGAELGKRLPAFLQQPGHAASEHVHWVFPVLARPREQLIAALRMAGFDATTGTTSIVVAEPAPPEAARLLADVVFVPAYPELPERAFARLLAVLRDQSWPLAD